VIHDNNRDRTAVFCVLWAIAQMGHLLRKADPSDPLVWLLLAAAVLLLDRPLSSLRLGLMAFLQLVYWWTEIPFTDNHLYIMAFVNLGLLTAVVSGRFQLPVRYLQATVLLSYGAAAIAKLNSGFFSLDHSCAVEMLYDALLVLGIEPGSLPIVEPLLPYFIAGTELLVPILLLIGPTRRAGVVLVVIFHLMMSLSPTATALDFTLVLFALVFLFLPADTASRIRLPALPASSRRAALVLLSFFLTISLVAQRGSVAGNRNWLWLAVTAIAIGILLLALALSQPKERLNHRARQLGLLAWPYVVFLALQLLNIAAPYLGSKSVGSFTMYSNLRTEDGQSNHFLIGRLPLRMGQDDLVQVIESSNGYLQRAADQGKLITWHELCRRLSADPHASIAYQRDGVLRMYQEAGENPQLVRRTLAHRFIAHRLYDPDEALCCW
jgi:hypothetical protein